MKHYYCTVVPWNGLHCCCCLLQYIYIYNSVVVIHTEWYTYMYSRMKVEPNIFTHTLRRHLLHALLLTVVRTVYVLTPCSRRGRFQHAGDIAEPRSQTILTGAVSYDGCSSYIISPAHPQGFILPRWVQQSPFDLRFFRSRFASSHTAVLIPR